MDTKPVAPNRLHAFVAAVCATTLLSSSPVILAQQPEPSPSTAPESQSPALTPLPSAPAEEAATKIPGDQLDSLVAPIALYPDPLLAQTLAASTYPLEMIQLQQWMTKNKNLKDKALSDAVAKQNWDPSVQAMAAFPDVVKRMADSIQWTTDLGNAFLAQQSDVMDAVQRMRAKADAKGTLKTTTQQKVSKSSSDGKEIIVVEPAQPNVVYVPSYEPSVVYGPPVYPYPPIYYPPPGYYAAGMAIAFGAGVALGAAWGGGWGWNCGWGWGHGDININVKNKYVNNWTKNNYNKANFNRANVNNANFNRAKVANRTNINQGAINNGKWQHNPEHRGGAPYNRESANQIQRQLQDREQRGERTGDRTRPGAGGAGERRTTDRMGTGGAGERRTGQERPGAAGAGERRTTPDRLGQGGAGERRPDRGEAGNRGRDFNRGGGGERIGSRNLSPEFGHGSAFGGGGGFDGSAARASSRRGARSMGNFHGGGFRGGGRRR